MDNDNDSASEQELCETTDSEDDNSDVSDDKLPEEGVTESLSDIDDAEVGSYLNNEKEKEYKKIIWEMMNQKYLQEQEAKRADATSNSKRDLKHKKATRVKKTQPTTKPARPISPKKRLSSRINYEILSKVLEEPLPSYNGDNPKKRRVDLDSDSKVGESSTGTQVKDTTEEIEDDGNGWEDDSKYSHYNNPEEEYDFYDDDEFF